MKIIHLFVLALLFITDACKNDASTNKINDTANNSELEIDPASSVTSGKSGAIISFDEERHDFGNLVQGEKAFYSFKFKNTGTSDLIISTARGSCGCTVPTYSKKPIQPGAEGKIDVVFNSENQSGISQKNITVLTNSEPDGIKILTIRSNVIAPDGSKTE